MPVLVNLHLKNVILGFLITHMDELNTKLFLAAMVIMFRRLA